jgi:hypothetical protein
VGFDENTILPDGSKWAADVDWEKFGALVETPELVKERWERSVRGVAEALEKAGIKASFSYSPSSKNLQ